MCLILCVSEADIWTSLAAHPGARQFPHKQPRAHPASARRPQPLLRSPHTLGWTLGVAPTPQPAGSLLTLLCPFLPLETVIPPPPDRPCTSRPSGHASSVDWVPQDIHLPVHVPAHQLRQSQHSYTRIGQTSSHTSPRTDGAPTPPSSGCDPCVCAQVSENPPERS